MPELRPLVHVGYHKTGSTWLQLHVFRSKELGFALCGGGRKVKRHIVVPHDLAFEPSRCRQRFVSRFEREIETGLVPVLSAERLCGDVGFGAYDSVRLADRLAATFPEAKVLIVIREQRSMVFSTYQQYVRRGGMLPLERYLNRPASHEWAHPWPCDLRHFEYDLLIAHYHQLFGRANVLVLPYELFRRDAVDFIRRIIAFAGASGHVDAERRLPVGEVSNPSVPVGTVALKRYLNYVVREQTNAWAPIHKDGILGRASGLVPVIGNSLPPAFHARIEARMRERIAKAVGRRYCASNARTERLTNLVLRGYGYQLDSSEEAPDVTETAPTHA
jgi:Sulfotransferase family